MVKTQQVLVEICPQCNTLHRYHVDNGLMREVGASEHVCKGVLGYKRVPQEQNATKGKDGEAPEPIPILCDYNVTPSDTNLYTIKRWSFAQRRQFYKQSRIFDVATGTAQGRLDPDIMVWVLLNGITASPVPLNTRDEIDNADVDGALLEALHGMILDYNTPPLSQSSVLRQESTRRMQALLPKTN